jgi:FdhD protein
VERPDTVVVEEPLEIRVDGTPVTSTMRTPGDDFDLTLGHLVTEGLLHDVGQVSRMMHCTDEDESGAPTYNVVDVTLAPGARLDAVPRTRGSGATSACGVCGTSTIAAVRTALPYAVGEDRVTLSPQVLAHLPDGLSDAQRVFARTGGAHAAGLFTRDGTRAVVREDVGRHNAVDKVVGWAAREGLLPLSGHVLCVSARASFELVQKAAVAGIPALVAVSAPSSLAVELARELGMTLVAFARPPSLTVFAGGDRVGDAGSDARRSDRVVTPDSLG